MRELDGRSAGSGAWWSERRVVVIGGTGFIGSHLVERLLVRGARVRVVSRGAGAADRFLGHVRDRVELVEADCGIDDEARRAVKGCDVVIGLAGTVAGIAMNRTRPALMFARNARVVIPMFEACVTEGVERAVYVSSACVYPREVSIPTPEEEGSIGDPEATNLGYGWAKRVGEIAARLYALEYGLKVSVVRPYNAYGPRDDFDTATSHVIPSLIRRVHEEAGDLEVWGSGRQTRSFVYVDDLAQGIIAAAERAKGAGPINLGSEEEISIGDLARTILELSGRSKGIAFDTSRPDGQPRRQPDLRRAREELGFVAPTPMREGLRNTIAYYLSAVAPVA